MSHLLTEFQSLRGKIRNVRIGTVKEIDTRTCELYMLLPEPSDLDAKDLYWTAAATRVTAEWKEQGGVLSLSTIIELQHQPNGQRGIDWMQEAIVLHARTLEGVHVGVELKELNKKIVLRCVMEGSLGGGVSREQLRSLLETMLPIFCTEAAEFALVINAPFINYIFWQGSRA